MTDKKDFLKTNPFDYRFSKEKLFITYKSKEIMVLKGKNAAKLMGKIYGEDDYSVQLALAKVTGHFKH